ncbi:glycine cleavage system aminomethyltransferase GcvT [Sulfurospirillum arcachonense]|uniref:glycine cleavage system aminomethyltransferase GcvT n=1 Tax=Sulfurospirillum arcachonense TaxID=57666 RepID=UPI000467F130|nr:glycine cleavage system aminomethyltransferase GcvT [Sulfurospirillum arcachonense]
MDKLKRTALFEKHQELNAKNIGFCGWEMPVQYAGILKEHEACRNNAALFDTSHMGEFFFEGNLLFSGINDTTTVDVLKLPIGKCKYGFLLNKDGGVIDDLIVYKAGPDRLMFVVNASRIEIDYETINSQLHNGVFTNASEQTSKLDIQGPKAKEILQDLVTFDLDELSFFSFAETDIMDSFALVSRTGYTGEVGYELYLDNTTAPLVWDKLIKRGAIPAGLGARDVLRLEMGYSLYGQELDETTTPIEAGIGFFVGYEKHFTGKEALLKQKEEGAPKQAIAFTTNSKRAPRHGMDIYQNDQKIGVVTSGTFSPSINSGIGLGSVQTKLYKKDAPIELRNERGNIPIFKTTLPFYKK